MRPQQQNRRMRGRNNSGGGGNNNSNNSNNNRKGPNPLTRNYESNGPDVKIRGSAQQIAEKYATLARDAHSSGDRVMAENYLQHAEHYNRIIAAAQAQMPIQNTQQNRDEFDDDGDDDRDEFDNAGSNAGEASAPAVNHGAGPQPVIEGTPAELAFNQESGRDSRDNGGRDNSGRDNSGGRHRDRRPNGGHGQNGQRGEFGSRGEQRGDQNRRNETPVHADAVVQAETGVAPQAEGLAPRAETGFVPQAESSFVPQAEPVFATESAPKLENFSPAALAAQAELKEAAADSGAARRPRRPRRPRLDAGQADGANSNAGDVAAPGERGGEPVVADTDR